jgi:hypothetical protein
MTRKRQDIRPRALQGKANLQMNASTTKTSVGENIDVKLSMYLTDAKLRVSGADIVVLYEKDKLDPINVVPAVSDSGSPFTDAPIVSSGGNFDNVYNYLRISEVSRKANKDLPPTDGTPIVPLGMVTFKAKNEGKATIKYPDDNKYLEIVGISSDSPPPTSPTISVVPSVPNGDASLVLVPDNQTIKNGSTIEYKLILTVKNGSTTRKLDYFFVQMQFPNNLLEMPEGTFISSAESGLKTIIRKEGPVAANGSGEINIELGADKPNNGPMTDKPITIAKFTMKGKAVSTDDQYIKIVKSQVVDNQSVNIPVTSQDTKFSVK